jgi:endonuclease/exonuclease/phosphatase family metal-dependent hydrolase
VNEGIAMLARPELGLRRVGKKRLSGNAVCSATWGLQTRESRYVLFGEITVGGRPVLLATAHLHSRPFVPPGFEEDLERLVDRGIVLPEQRDEIVGILERGRARILAEVEGLLQEIDRHRGKVGGRGELPPVVLGGDFNAEPGTPSIAAVERRLTNVATGPGFLTRDPVTNHVNHGIGAMRGDPVPTFDIEAIRDLIEPSKTTARQIDFIFVSEAFEILEADMVMTRDRDGILPSDHFAILAHLRLE